MEIKRKGKNLSFLLLMFKSLMDLVKFNSNTPINGIRKVVMKTIAKKRHAKSFVKFSE